MGMLTKPFLGPSITYMMQAKTMMTSMTITRKTKIERAVLRSDGGDAVRAVVTDKGGGKYEGRYTVPEGTEVPDEGATWQLARSC